MKDARRKKMEALIAQKQTVSMEMLRDTFGVSMNTVRADVAYLVQTGSVEKVYGGVRVVSHQEVPLFTQRTSRNLETKRQIAYQAETLIHDGDVIYIDAGTTTMHLIDWMSPAKHVTILTANLYVINQAISKTNVELISLPGMLNRRTNAAADGSTMEFLGHYQFTKAFMGASSISSEGRLNVSTYTEYEIKKLAVRQCSEAYLLADSSKFGGTGLMSYGTLENMKEIITDSGCPDEVRQYCASHGLSLTIVPSF